MLICARFVTCLDANKTGLRTLHTVWEADDLAWKRQNLPTCMAPRVKAAYGFLENSPFILDLLRRRGKVLEDELLGAYRQLGLSFTRDDTLLEPARRAELFARRMQLDRKLDLWVNDLDRLRGFVDGIRKAWPAAAAAMFRERPRSAEDITASINALVKRFELDAPRLDSFALYSAAELAALRASLVYATCKQDNEKFAYAVAFRDLCRIKASATDAAVIVRSLADVLTMQRSTRAALGGNVVGS